VLAAIVQQVPEAWLGPAEAAGQRQRYLDYLLTRLAAPRPFIEEVERARAA